MQKVVIHNGSFHADDIFAVATLQLHFGVENIEVVRTRDEDIIASGDIVVDVGGVYDPARQRFDHHQNGAPVRENSIPYAAFGLIWKEYGEQVAGTPEVAAVIEKRLVLPIDAVDNAISLYVQKNVEISPVTIQDIFALMRPVNNSDQDEDASFHEVCAIARRLLEMALVHAQADLVEEKLARQAYEEASDKRVVISKEPVSAHYFTDYPECLFLVSPRDDDNWKATAIRVDHDSFETKKSFPPNWRGLRDKELVDASGITDSIFCHKTGYLFVAKTKEGVVEAVEKVLAK